MVDGSIDAMASAKRFIGRSDDGINFERGVVANGEPNPLHGGVHGDP